MAIKQDVKRCPDCGAKIKLTRTETDTKVFVDLNLVAVQPNLRGGVAIVTPDGKVVLGRLAMVGDKGSVQGYTSHASTCRSRKEGRRK